MGYGYWALEEREGGAYLGEVGFSDFHRDIKPSIDGIPELGWILAPRAHGKGFATEAALAAIAWGQANFRGIERIACIISPANRASIRIAEKCGFTAPAPTTYLDSPVLLYTRSLRPEPE
jgi:RimJ/RimL family protein N-acetyltransferase